MIGVRRYAHLSREIVGCAHRDDPKRYVVSVEPIHNFVDRSVAAGRGHDVHAAMRGGRREHGRVTRLERGQYFHEVALVADPAHEVAQIGSIDSPPVDDERDVFGAHARA